MKFYSKALYIHIDILVCLFFNILKRNKEICVATTYPRIIIA